MIRHFFIAGILLILSFRGKTQAPVANFSVTAQSGCASLNISFKDESTGNPKYWNWDFGNGQLSSAQNPAASYHIPGVYTVRLVVRNENGTDGITKTNYITVFPSPSVNFKADYNTACAPIKIQFTDLTTVPQGSITSWLWDFGDGTTSSAQNPSKTFTATGYYNVSLTVKTSNGCESTASRVRFLRIIAGITPQFDFTRVGTCTLPVVANFINQTTGPGTISYNWDFGDGQTSTVKNPGNNYAALGTYNVKLQAQSNLGCKAEITKPITFGATNTQIGAPDSSCPNKPISFTNTSTPAPLSSVWDFGDGTQSTQLNPSKTYTTPGTYTVTLTSKYAGCSGTVTKNIIITNPPVADFTSPNPNGCKLPYNVKFQNTSPGAVSYLWNFGDGFTSTDAAPSHNYTRTGSFDVTLSIVTATGCPATVVKNAFVNINTNLSLSLNGMPKEGCKPLSFSPTANIVAPDGVTSYVWSFGDGGIIYDTPTPTYIYTTSGTYDVKLKITTTGGCVDSFTVTKGVKVGDPSSVDFNFTGNPGDCANNLINFTSITPSADKWSWNFGDGAGSDLQNPSHQFADTGSNISVSLTAYTNGCSGTVAKIMPRLIGPVAKFKPTIDCTVPQATRLTVNFLNQSLVSAADAAIATYSWNFGPGAVPLTSNLKDPPPVTYPAKGQYLVTLVVAGVNCTYKLEKTIDLDDQPADFTVKSQVCRNEPFRIAINNNTIDTAEVKSYQWQIGGGTPFLGKWYIDSSFSNFQNSPITLAITDTFGCTNVKTIPFAVVGADADFSVTNNGGCINTDIQFVDQSVPAGIFNSWRFDFGDSKNQTFTAAPFTHRYIDSGTYNILLYAKDIYGCSDTLLKPKAVRITKSIANFGAEYTLFCQGGLLQFQDSSKGNNLTYNWNFGDGGSSVVDNPTHIYTGSDSVYTVKLKVTDAVGCSDSLTRANYIRVIRPKPAFTAKDTMTICPPLQTFFTSTSRDYDSLFWDFGDGNISTLDTISNFYNNYGTFNAKLYTYGYGGCVDSASKVIHVYNPAVDAGLSYGPPIENCNTLSTVFTITTPPVTRFIFYAGDGFVDSSQNKTISHTYATPNVYNPMIILKDSLECEVAVGGPNQIRVNGVLPLFNIDNKRFCDNGTIFLTDFSIGNDVVTSRVWDFGDGTTSVITNPSHTYNQPGTFLVKQSVTTQKGCANSFTDTVRVYRTPDVVINSPNKVCIKDLLQLHAGTVVPDTGIVWKWTIGSQISSDSIVNITPTIPGSLNVKLVATNPINCADTTTKIVPVYALPVITMPDAITTVIGANIVIPASYNAGMTTYSWTPATYLSCTDCPRPEVIAPKFATNYTVNVVDSNNCKSSESIRVVTICNEKNFFIPNTFSPNGDGTNDWFYPRGTFLNNVQSMTIFNRWGEMIFQKKNFPANNMMDGWNGTYKGKPGNADTYIYIIEIVCENAMVIPIKGNVTLIR